MNESALPELPGGWVWTNVGEICELINGRAFKPEEWATQGIPIIRIQNLNNSNTDFNYCNFEVEEKYIVNNGQLLFAWSGTPGTSFGAHIWNRGRAVLNQHIFKIGFNENCINKIFFKYLINRNIDEYIGKAHGTAGLAHITKNKFENSIISIPPFSEQHRIVTKLEELFTSLDAGVSELKKTQDQLKRYRQSVLKAACEGKLVPTEAELAKVEGHTYEPADVLLARILKERREKWNGKGKYKEPEAPDTSGLPALPEGWGWSNVGQMTDSMKNVIYKPSEFYTEDGFACLRMYNIEGSKIVWKDIKRMNLSKEEIGEFLLLPDDILVNRVNSRELVGKAAVIPLGIEKCVFESKNIRVRIIDMIVNPHYLCYRFTLAGTEYSTIMRNRLLVWHR